MCKCVKSERSDEPVGPRSLVRDRVGIKPGFYHKAQPGGFYEGGFLGFYGFYKSESLS